jgi:hypothetical protein
MPIARAAVADDIDEIVRLVAAMFLDLGDAEIPASWAGLAAAALHERLWVDVGAFVVDTPDSDGLAAVAVGLIETRLPSPRRRCGGDSPPQQRRRDGSLCPVGIHPERVRDATCNRQRAFGQMSLAVGPRPPYTAFGPAKNGATDVASRRRTDFPSSNPLWSQLE